MTGLLGSMYWSTLLNSNSGSVTGDSPLSLGPYDVP